VSFLRRRRGTPNQTRSRSQEKRLAHTLGGRVTPGSGSGSVKGDVHTPEDMVEAKTTSKSQFTLRLDVLRKLEHEAKMAGKRPRLVLQIEDGSPLFLFHNEWVILPMQDYLAMKEAAHG
jgi:hypothetical protein